MELVEKYKNIPETEFVPLECVPEDLLGSYEINKLGHIKTVKSGYIRTEFSCNSSGYPAVDLTSSSKTVHKSFSIHTLLAKTFLSNPNNYPVVHHLDKNRKNFNLNNIIWTSLSHNASDKSENRDIWYFIKYKDELFTEEVERISFKKFSNNQKSHILHHVKDGKKYQGFYWKSVNIELEDYYKRFGYPKEEDWVPCLRFPDYLECNINGVLRYSKTKKNTIGSLNSAGYRVIKVNDKSFLIHRLVYESFSGRFLKDNEIIDHKNTIRDSNFYQNLLATDPKGNMANSLTRLKLSKEVFLFDLSGNIVKRFHSIRSFADEYGMNEGSVRYSLSLSNQIKRTGFSNRPLLICRSGEEEVIIEKFKKLIFKYDINYNFVCTYFSCEEAAKDSIKSEAVINRATNSESNKCSDGFYYTRGPKYGLNPKSDLIKIVNELKDETETN